MEKWRKLMFIGLFLFVGLSSHAQWEDFNRERVKLDKRLMVSIGGWATTNLVVGGVGWATTPKGEANYFHQMNFLWNTVNLGLAIPGYFKARKENANLSFGETLRAQNKTETIFLINSGLDIAYMSSGLLLRSEARFQTDKRDQWMEFGNSLLMQGGFLFVFDLTAYILHKRHNHRKLDGFLNQIEFSQTGMGLRWNVPSKRVERSQWLANH